MTVSGCSGRGERAERETPAWTTQPARTVDGGYIIYVGTGEDAVPERAQFKAEATALQDLANECSFAPKGTRVEDRFEQPTAGVRRAFAKVAIEFQDCERAKFALSVEAIREIASVPIAEQLKQYRELVDAPEPEETSTLAERAHDIEDNDEAAPSASHPAPIQNPTQWVTARERVVFVKQDVILAPLTAYPPASPAATRVGAELRPQAAAVRGYETAHPELTGAESHVAFSGLRTRAEQHRAYAHASAVKEAHAARAARAAAAPHGRPGKSRKRRRRSHGEAR